MIRVTIPIVGKRKKMNKKISRFKFIGLIIVLLLSGCSDAPSEEEISEAITEVVKQEVNKAVEQTVGTVKEEGKQKAQDLLEEGTGKLEEWLGEVSLDPSEVLKTEGTTQQYKMEYISNFDGDTYTLLFLEGPNKGQKVKVRQLLLDSSEVSKGHPFSSEAQERAQELLESGAVTLEYDVGDKFDHYQRTLAYIRIDGEHIGTKLIEAGLAYVRYVNPPNTRYLDEFKEAETRAKEKGIGIWSIENYVTENNGFKP